MATGVGVRLCNTLGIHNSLVPLAHSQLFNITHRKTNCEESRTHEPIAQFLFSSAPISTFQTNTTHSQHSHSLLDIMPEGGDHFSDDQTAILPLSLQSDQTQPHMKVSNKEPRLKRIRKTARWKCKCIMWR